MSSNTNEKKEEPFHIVEGVAIPLLFEKTCERPMGEHMERLKGMEMSHEDVILAACGKAGTHWMWEVAYMVLSGKAEYEKRTKEFSMMEATSIEKLESQPPPRIFNSHLPMFLLPRQIKEKKVRIIHVYRNVKDIIVSNCFHIRQLPGRKEVTFEDTERRLLSLEGGREVNFITYHQGMYEYKKKNPDVPFLTVSFEDAKEDPERIIWKIGEFLGVEMSPKLCQEIAEATSFKKMKEADKGKQQADLPYVQMYRKGEVGDWKNYLTVAQSERIDEAMKQLDSCDYHFRYTL